MNRVTEEKIAFLERDMQTLLTELRKAAAMDETTFDYFQSLWSINKHCDVVHVDVASWQLLVAAILGKNR